MNQVNIANTARVEGGVGGQAIYSIEPVSWGGNQLLDVNRINTPLTVSEKAQRSLPANGNYVYASLPLANIGFEFSRGYVMKVISGANQGGTVNAHYRFLGSNEQLVPQLENYSDASRWQQLNQSEVDALPTGNTPFYDSDVTIRFTNALQNKFYVVKHADLPGPTLSVRNLGNLLLAERARTLQWIQEHAGNAEAIARYEGKLLAIDAKLADIGLTEDFTVAGITHRLVLQNLDQLFLDIPGLTASPGSVYIQADGVSPNVYQPLVGSVITAGANARIDIQNRSPFTMAVNGAIMLNAIRNTVANGQHITLQPGNVYVNYQNLTNVISNSTQTININQDAFGSLATYDLSGLPSSPPISTKICISCNRFSIRMAQLRLSIRKAAFISTPMCAASR